MPSIASQTQTKEGIHLALDLYADSDLHSSLRRREQTMKADLRGIQKQLKRLHQTGPEASPPARAFLRHRNRRQRSFVTAPRAFQSMFSRSNPHGTGAIWTLADFASALICGFVATLLRRSDWVHVTGAGWLAVPSAFGRGLMLALVTALATATLSRVLGLHDVHPHRSSLRKQGLILLAAALSVLGVKGAAEIWGFTGLSTELLALNICLTFALMSLSRILWRKRSAMHYKRGIVTRNFIIAGADQAGREVRDYLTSLAYLGYNFRGFIQIDEIVDPQIPTEQLLGTINDIIPLSRTRFADEIIFSKRPETSILISTLDGARSSGIDVRLIPSVSETLQNRTDVHYVGNLPTIVLHQRHTRAVSLFMKRVLDVGAATIGIAATSPIWAAVALAIKLDSTGSLFYASNRVGFKGRVFPCYKFRTMVSDAEKRRSEFEHLNEREGVLFKIANDPRITRVGKFLRKYSLDELPQLWNVLCGDMSMVGPRPPISSEVAQYEIDHLRRLEVTPGITGLWQVEARNHASFESYIELDRAYVSNWSIGLDLKILFRTVKVVLMGTGT
jgi:exopolysaccharide biosynthesis polyprenyl glycosylphosphotransferase